VIAGDERGKWAESLQATDHRKVGICVAVIIALGVIAVVATFT